MIFPGDFIVRKSAPTGIKRPIVEYRLLVVLVLERVLTVGVAPPPSTFVESTESTPPDRHPDRDLIHKKKDRSPFSYRFFESVIS